MKKIYAAPLRVYLCLGALALAGIIAGFQLPVSLFPNSSKPIIGVMIPYGNNTPTEFIKQHGNRIETLLHTISIDSAEVDKTRAYYTEEGARYEIEFKWGSQSRSALKEVETVIHSYASQLTEEVRNRTSIYPQNSNSGFFAASFYSSERSLDELYRLIEPILMPQIVKLRDVSNPELYNPLEKEVRIELNNDRMASFQLLPKDVDQAVKFALTAFNGGSITVGIQQMSVQVPRAFSNIDDLNDILIPTPAKQAVHLTDVAKVDYDLKTTNVESFKTSGTPSVILFSRPRPGGNVKRMSEEMIQAIESIMPSMPQDIHYKTLVDPSEFIRSAVKNVFHEVAIGAFLAVLILFVFIGSFKNTITAAIEIPLSMVMAFIPMKLSGMSLNLISLGGLALSAGMNVDASVVVMENIFRHFEASKENLDSKGKLRILVRAVNEVKFPVIASTIASLVVFLPLAFTSDLTYAILGDLAKAVVFSHGFSAFVALILVPTVRLQLMSHGGDKISHSPFEKYIKKIENLYIRLLRKFLDHKNFQRIAYLGLVFTLFILSAAIFPRLPKEVIGKPDTEDIAINVNTQGNTLIKQMEETAGDIESKLLKQFKGHVDYTFVNIYQPNSAWIMAHLKDKSEMRKLWKEMEVFFPNSPTFKYEVNPWNPAELAIPDPPQMKLTIRGGTLKDRARIAQDLYQLLEENQVFPRLWTDPSVSRTENVVLRPYMGVWSHLRAQAPGLDPSDLADWVRVMTSGRKIGEMTIDGMRRDVTLRSSAYPHLNAEDIGAIPIGVGGKIIPIKALSQVKVEEAIPSIYQEDQRELFAIYGKQNEGDPSYLAQERLKKAENLVKTWQDSQTSVKGSSAPMIIFEDAGKEVHEAMNQLLMAVILSVVLIFLILMIQFGNLMSTLLVLVSIPLGIIGVFISLFIFGSTLSLNSILGVILLNGIAVANSIILVDFLKQRVEQGLSPYDAALDAGKKRLRPILITSLTTILGMFPVALGLGEGGRVLQPLGIAVAGGLWVSMGLTLFVVPALQVQYLTWKRSRRPHTLNLTLMSWVFCIGLLSIGFLTSIPGRAEEPLNFNSAVNKIVSRSTAVNAQESTWSAIHSRNLPKRLYLLPNLSFFARTPLGGATNLFPLYQQLELTSQWNLFRWGADYMGMLSANYEEDSQRSVVHATVLQTEGDAIQAIVTAIQRKKEVEINSAIVKSQTELSSVAQERYKKGFLPLQEAEKVEVDLGNAKASFIDAQMNETDARANLENLLGNSNIVFEWPWMNHFKNSKKMAIIQQKQNFTQRPDWKAAQNKVESMDYKVSQSWRQLLPTLDAQFSYGHYSSYAGSATGWVGFLSVTFPLFDHLTNYSNAKEQSYMRSVTETQLEQVQRTARADWESSRKNFQMALESALSRDATLTLSRKLYQDNLKRFQAGRITSNDLAVDRSRMYQSELNAIQGWSAVHLSFGKLCHSLGYRIESCVTD